MSAAPCLPGLEGDRPTISDHAAQFFPTPPEAVDAILPHIWPHGYDGRSVCELGAGDGHILRRLRAFGVPREAITAVELRPQCAERLAPLAGRVLCPTDALEFARISGFTNAIAICNPPYGDMLGWAQACLQVGREGWLLGLLSFMGSAGRSTFHRIHQPDGYVMTWRPDFTGGGANPRDHAWFRFPGTGQWQPLDRRPALATV